MTEVIMASIFVLSSFYGAPTVAIADGISTSTTVAPLTRMDESTISNLPSRNELEEIVKRYFKDDPILIEIARCESQFRQFDAKGNVLKGKVNKGDLGLMQINKYYHADQAKALGYNLRTIEGNLAYAKYLYDKEGVQPWKSSSPCWRESLNKSSHQIIALK